MRYGIALYQLKVFVCLEFATPRHAKMAVGGSVARPRRCLAQNHMGLCPCTRQACPVAELGRRRPSSYQRRLRQMRRRRSALFPTALRSITPPMATCSTVVATACSEEGHRTMPHCRRREVLQTQLVSRSRQRLRFDRRRRRRASRPPQRRRLPCPAAAAVGLTRRGI